MDLDRHASHIEELRRAILETPGATEPEERVAVAAGVQMNGVADDYLAKVRTASYRIVDDEVASMRRSGLSEDAILELTLAAAFGEASRRFDSAIAALHRARSPDHAP